MSRICRGLAMVAAAVSLSCATAQAAVPLKACASPEATDQGGRCGSITVPLDRADPASPTLRIGFELYRAKKPAQRVGTVVVFADGPGIASTNGFRGAGFIVVEGLRDRFDLLLVDRRGTGKSAPVDCKALQHGTGPQAAAIAACGAQVGGNGDRYGAADVAEDLEAVRAALEIERLDLYGATYGAVEAAAYAFRHPDRVRSLVFASPVTPFELDPWGASQARAAIRAVREYCARSQPCTRSNGDPTDLLTRLAERLRTAPVQGRAPNREGKRVAVVADEAALGRVVRFMLGDMVNHGELPGAARALLQDDDPAPLLRLVAESTAAKGDADQGKPGDFISLGALTAALCTDASVPWDRAAARDVRAQQLEAARAALPADRFGPFSVAGWTGAATDPWYGFFELVGSYTQSRPGPCIDWPAPDRVDPVIPAGAVPPAVPTLFLSSTTSVHTPSEDVTAMAARFPGATTIEISGMDHMPVLVEPCVQGIVRRFVRDLAPGARRCAPDPGGPWYAPGGFPERVRDATAARRGAAIRARSSSGARPRSWCRASPTPTTTCAARARASSVSAAAASRSCTTTRGRSAPTRSAAAASPDLRVDGSVTIDFEHGQRVTGTLRASGPGLGAARWSST